MLARGCVLLGGWRWGLQIGYVVVVRCTVGLCPTPVKGDVIPGTSDHAACVRTLNPAPTPPHPTHTAPTPPLHPPPLLAQGTFPYGVQHIDTLKELNLNDAGWVELPIGCVSPGPRMS